MLVVVVLMCVMFRVLMMMTLQIFVIMCCNVDYDVDGPDDDDDSDDDDDDDHVSLAVHGSSAAMGTIRPCVRQSLPGVPVSIFWVCFDPVSDLLIPLLLHGTAT